MLWQRESIRKITGGRRRPAAMKRRAEIGLAPADTHIGEDRRRIIRTFGGNEKSRALRASVANVTNRERRDEESQDHERRREQRKPELCPAEPAHEGRYLKTEIGRARIMSRPGQDGVINAVLLE